jgi:hypothetical protein
MSPEETGKLLGACAAYDNRQVDEAAVIAWYRVVGDLPYPACEAAVSAHYAESREWIMPADIRGRVKRALRSAEDASRLRELLNPDAYRAEIAAADSAFLRKLAARTGRQPAVRAITEAEDRIS